MASTLNADNGSISGSSGLKSSADASGVLALQTNGTTAMTINTSQNVGIGTSSPTVKLDIVGNQISLYNPNADTSNLQLSSKNASFDGGWVTLKSINTANGSNALAFATRNAYTEAERMRIDSSGNLLVGLTVTPTTAWNGNSHVNFQYGVQFTHPQSNTKWRQITWSSDGADANLYFPGGTALNTVANTAALSSAGAWTNASDGRNKTNIKDLDYGLNTVMQTKPRRYNRIDTEGEFVGFVAQELLEVIPEVVVGSENTSYGVSYGELVSVAFKAIQELKAEVDSLKAQISG